MVQGRYGSEILFPHVSVWSRLGAGPCSTSITSQISASLGRRERKGQVERAGTGRDHDKNRIPIHRGNYTKGHILSDHTRLCGWEENPHPEPCILGFSTVLWAMGRGALTLVTFINTHICRNQKKPRSENGPVRGPSHLRLRPSHSQDLKQSPGVR